MLIRVKSCHAKDLRKRFRYLLLERAKGVPRDQDKCFVGHRDAPEEVFIRSVEQAGEGRRTYWSVVVSLHPRDREKFVQHMPQVIADLVEEFKRGYPEGDRPLMHAVVHLDEDNPHIHLTVLNRTEGGRASRWWYFRRDQAWLEAVQRYIRAKYSFVDPRDKEVSCTLHEDRSRARLEAIKRLVERARGGDEDARRKAMTLLQRDRLRKEVHRVCEMAYLEGEVQTREELVEWLRAQGLKVTRVGRDYITVAVPLQDGREVRIRLRGSIYAQDFRVSEGDTGSQEERGRGEPDLEGLRREIEEAGAARFRDLGRSGGGKEGSRGVDRDRGGVRVDSRVLRWLSRWAKGSSSQGGSRRNGQSGWRVGVSLRSPAVIYPFRPIEKWRVAWWCEWERLMNAMLSFPVRVWTPSKGWQALTPRVLPSLRDLEGVVEGPTRERVPVNDLVRLGEVVRAFVAKAKQARQEEQGQRQTGEEVVRERESELERLVRLEEAELREREREREREERERASRVRERGGGYLSPGM